ncbi:MAG TPA: hypothetical protein VGH14_18105 [Solirubrobacterales bacterium]|jgi:hypothetical protein
MLIGIYLRELWRHKLGLVVVGLIAALATVQVVWGIGIPPQFGKDSLQMASASAEVIVDTPRSSAVNPQVDAYTLKSLSNRALIVGNVMASLPVREYIAAQAGVPLEKVRVEAPLTPEQPRPLADSAHSPHITDLIKRPDEYRLSVQATPMAPVLELYAVAPTAAAAQALTTSAVEGLRTYLASLDHSQKVPVDDQVRLERLGVAQSGAIASNAAFQLGLLTFLVVFALGCVALLALERVRRGWGIGPNAGPPFRPEGV